MSSDTKNLLTLGSGTSGFKTWEERITKYKELGTPEEVITDLIMMTNPRPELLETFDNQNPDNFYIVPFVQPKIEFVSNCPKTGAMDFARIEFIYVPNIKMVESKSAKLYLASFKNAGCFHEDTINMICNDLFNLLQPKYIRVLGDYVSRGALAIKPIVEKWEKNLTLDQKNDIIRLISYYDIKI